jgi:dienelactone hydrolase
VRPSFTFLLAVAALASASVHARLVEDQLDVPVRVNDAYGKVIEHTIKVTVFSDPENPKPAPILVLNHGRAVEVQERVNFGRARFSSASWYFVRRGFIVAVPTRVGYGVTGGDDVEDSGNCSSRNFPPGFAAAAQQTLAVLGAVRRRPDAAADRAVVIGQSYGGATTVAIAALNPSGVQAAINFAGGSGGNPRTQPQRPCSPHLLERVFKGYGATAKMPMLWVYAENDMYFGPSYPKEWHAAFKSAGGDAEFVQFPPHGEDGHGLFTRFPAVWQPKVAAFLEAHGFKAPARTAAPAFAALEDQGKVPHLKDTGRAVYKAFLEKVLPRAFAIAPNGAWGWAQGGEDPEERALTHCNRKGLGACKPYVVDDEVVWKE